MVVLLLECLFSFVDRKYKLGLARVATVLLPRRQSQEDLSLSPLSVRRSDRFSRFDCPFHAQKDATPSTAAAAPAARQAPVHAPYAGRLSSAGIQPTSPKPTLAEEESELAKVLLLLYCARLLSIDHYVTAIACFVCNF